MRKQEAAKHWIRTEKQKESRASLSLYPNAQHRCALLLVSLPIGELRSEYVHSFVIRQAGVRI